MTRRGRGEGAIRKRADGRWEGSIDIGDGGRRRRKSVYGRTRVEVAEKLRSVQRCLDTGRPVLDERIRVDAFLERWLSVAIKPNRSHSHWRGCEAAARLHINPVIGHLRLAKLTAADVQKLINVVRAKGLSDDTVRLVHASLRSALTTARRWGQVHDNVASLVEPLTVRRAEVVPLTEAELGRLLGFAREDRLGAYVTVAVALGLRPGEARALTWSDLELEGSPASLRVRRAFSRSPGGESLGPPKTPRSRRTIPLPAQLVDVLRDHRRRQLEERLLVGPGWHSGEFVFTQSDGRPLTERSLARWFGALCSRAGVDGHRLYDLRHTAASLLLAQGVPPRYVMEVLGHSTYRLTMDTYAHVMPAALAETAQAMGRALTLVSQGSQVTFGGQFGGQPA